MPTGIYLRTKHHLELLSEARKKAVISVKGKPLSEEHKRKISLRQIGVKKYPMPEHVKKMLISINTGKQRSQETKNKISKAHLGKKLSLERIEKIREMIKNKYKNGEIISPFKKLWKEKREEMLYKIKNMPKEIIEKRAKTHTGKIHLSNRGENNYRWIKDRNKIIGRHTRINDPCYKQWRREVYIRDNFKCKIYNQDCAGRIEAHHILLWSNYPELRYEINNGITLCQAHHPKKRAEEKQLIPYFMGLVETKV